MDPRLHWILASAALCGCFSPTGSVNTSSSTSTSELSTSGDASTGATEAATTGLASSTETGSTVASSTTSTGATAATTGGEVCGDGHLDEGEECDEGQLAEGCSSSCKLYRHVFVTSNVFSGELGGLAGADKKCQDAATAEGLPGIYRAWLSSSSESPINRFVHSTIPYRLVNGTEVAATWTELTGGSLAAGINVSEKNSTPGKGKHSCVPDTAPIVWTSTKDTGMPTGGAYTCSEWGGLSGQGSTGLAGSTDSTWTSNCLAQCSDEAALYCFEQ